MTEGLADERSNATAAHATLHSAWAAGGTGTLITGNVQIDRRYQERPGNVAIDMSEAPCSTPARSALSAWAAAGAERGAVTIVQLGHAGRQSTGMINMSPKGPGTVPLRNLPKTAYGAPTAFTVAEMEDIVARFAYAATVCAECGFDGVQIHAAHGYLLSSFMNPLANNRVALQRVDGSGVEADDPYCATLRDRAKPLLDVVAAVQEALRGAASGSANRAAEGERRPFAIGVKLNSSDFQKGGFTPQECVDVARWLSAAGVDFLEISGGNYDAAAMVGAGLDGAEEGGAGGADSAAARDRVRKKESTTRREAYFLDFARAIQSALVEEDAAATAAAAEDGGGVPSTIPMRICATGGFRRRAAMEAALDSIDLVGLGRPLCADPNIARQLIAGDVEETARPEETLVPGTFGFRWIPSLAGVISGMGADGLAGYAVQCWYYDQIRRVASGGGPLLRAGCYAALLRNLKAEAAAAKALVGVDCKGTAYGGLPK